MNRNLALEFVRVTEAAALASSRWMGRGDEKQADQAAVTAMRTAFNSVLMKGQVVIGEGERDKAPMLYIGEPVGFAHTKEAKKIQNTEIFPEIDIALDPLEGTTICAKGGVGATSVIAAAKKGNLLHAPDIYMDKLACGPKGKGCLSLDNTPAKNISILSEKLKKPISDLTVVVLERPRHEELIKQVRDTGARICLIDDGDVSAGIATCTQGSGIDLLLGIGGAPEGVITAAAIKCLDGDFQGRLLFSNEEEKQRASKMGISDYNKIYHLEQLATGPVLFAATGVTDGPFLKGVRHLGKGRVQTHSVVFRSQTKTHRYIQAEHSLKF
ncbi:MAG: class II fructose-bisphosphatase [Bdellovibrionaceae bacterium]|nr:class II fructose-bisphosphatase [Pseudobdellovibrionaceae bacterium]